MSVFSLDPRAGNPVTTQVLDQVCEELGVVIKDEEKEQYRRLLGVFHDSAADLMALPDYVPATDVERFPRENVHFPDKTENTHNAWAWKCSIKDKTEASKNGLLAGKTVALKDMISVKDVPMLMGTDFIKDHVPDMDATVVTRMLEAGAHITGKAVCENMCHSATSHSAATGPVDNPFAKGYSSGGSSSGSGVLVALGEVDMSVGADQGGSVRIPACNCGIVGLKPTFGLIPYTGCGSNEPTNDHLGPMTRTVYDNALLLQAIAGTDNIDDRSFAAPSPRNLPPYASNLLSLPTPTSLAGLKIGIIAESLTQPALTPSVRSSFLSATQHLSTLGATITTVSVPLHSRGPAIWTGISKVSGYLSKRSLAAGRRTHALLPLDTKLHPLTQQSWDRAYVSTKNIFLNGAYATRAFPLLLAKATNLSRELRDAYDGALEEVDVLVTPTLPFVAGRHCGEGAGPLDAISGQVGLTGNTCQFNQTGHPALTVPCGMAEAEGGEGVRLPVGLQVVGRWWGEEMVYRVGYAWERSTEWKNL